MESHIPMLNNILISLLFSIVMPLIFNVIDNRTREKKVQFDQIYFFKVVIVFLITILMQILWSYL